ncbi:hypothetical protein ACWGHM_37010 [Streptomyces sp. NPDC054904]
MIFKVIGDVHPGTHFLGYVKYYPDARGDRELFGRTYRQDSVVSKAFGILADRPECYLYSPAVGCVITGVPREDIVTHYSCRQTLTALHQTPGLLNRTAVGQDLFAINWIFAADVIGVTGSFLVGACNTRSDIDLVCYGARGYEAARALFAEHALIHPVRGRDPHPALRAARQSTWWPPPTRPSSASPSPAGRSANLPPTCGKYTAA